MVRYITPVIALLLGGCTADEPLINTFDDRWRLQVTSSTVERFAMPDGTSLDGNVLGSLGLPAWRVTGQVLFRDDVYLMAADTACIVVSDADTMQVRSVIDCGVAGPAAAFTAGNASTGYAVHPTTNMVSVIDLTVHRPVMTIPVGERPVAIAALGNQVGVVCQGASRLDIIDTRTNTVVASLPLPAAPSYIDVDPANMVFCVVSRGEGRLNANARTAPSITFVSAVSRAQVGQVECRPASGDGTTDDVFGVAVTPSSFAYVPISSGLLRISTRTRNRAAVVGVDRYDAIQWNPLRSELLVLLPDSVTVDVYDEFLEGHRARATTNRPVTSMVGLAP